MSTLFTSGYQPIGKPIVPTYGILNADASAAASSSSGSSTSTAPYGSTTADYTAPTPVWNPEGVYRAAAGTQQARAVLQKRNIGILGFVLFSIVALAQTDNTLYVKQFPGTTVGQKLTNAMAACNPDTSVPCILVLDPTLAKAAQGTMPTLCAQCSLTDYRSGGSGIPGVSSDGANGIKVSGAAKASIIDQGGQVFNVKAYGAAGDGAVDDTSAITNATSAASAIGGGTVFFPAGVYLIKTAITVPSNIDFQGVGTASEILASASFTQYAGVFTLSGVSNVRFQHLYFNGAADDCTNNFDLIKATNSSNIDISHNLFFNACQGPTLVSVSNASVSNNAFHDVQNPMGVWPGSTPSTNIKFDYNQFTTDANLSQDDYIAFVGDVHGATANGNVMNMGGGTSPLGYHAHCILLGSLTSFTWQPGAYISDVSVTGNTCYNQNNSWGGSPPNSWAFELKDYSGAVAIRNVTIASNTLENVYKGIFEVLTAGTEGNISIIGNTILTVAQNGGIGSTISNASFRGQVIASNTITGVNGRGISWGCGGGMGLIVSGNVISGLTGTLEGISIDTCPGAIVSHNVASGGPSTGLNVQNPSGVTISGNNFSGNAVYGINFGGTSSGNNTVGNNNVSSNTSGSYSGVQGNALIAPIASQCTTGSITPASSAGGTATGTCTIGTSSTGHDGIAAATDGSVQGTVISQVSVNGTTVTVTLTTVIASSPTAKSYNVTVF